jgi:hypothetical protein
MNLFQQVNSFLERPIKFSADTEFSLYALILRFILYIITASWVAFYPAYLLLIHMKVEKYFSYDVFTEGLFGIKSFLFLVFILITICALYLWGFVIFFRRAVLDKSKSFWLFGAIFVLVSFAFHYGMFTSGISSGRFERVVWMSALGFIFAVTVSAFMSNPLKNILSNWVAPLFGIIASATLPILNMDIASDVVKTGLENFKVGGGVSVSLRRVANGTEIISGKLLLLTPNYVYLREGKAGYTSISRTTDNYVIVD